MTTTTTRDAGRNAAKAALIKSLRSTHARGEQPKSLRGRDLRGVDLSGADLRNVDLSDADLQDADLRGAFLQNADLHGADLRYANLRDAYLRYTNLWRTDLRCADLRYANLRSAGLQSADLRDADLTGADLRGAHLNDAGLRGALGGVFEVTGLHPYQAVMVPTVNGWRLRIGCWEGTAEDLRDLIAQDDDWPEARGAQVTARRPLLNVLADMCDVHAANRKDDLDAVMKRWGAGAKG